MHDQALRTIAEIQTADPDELGLTGLTCLTGLSRDELGDTVIDQELEYWLRFFLVRR